MMALAYQTRREAVAPGHATIRASIESVAGTLIGQDAVRDLAKDVACALPPRAGMADLDRAMILAARSRIEQDPVYSRVAARALLRALSAEAIGDIASLDLENAAYRTAFVKSIHLAVNLGLLGPDLLSFDLERLSLVLTPERDYLLSYLGLQTLADRYLLQHNGRHLELPQMFWMRVAMGLALRESDRERWAIMFYDLMSTLRYVPSTPTLFNSGTPHPQLSSCYLSTIPDDLAGIFSAIRDNALLSKWSGGIGNDWTPVRALGSPIRGTNGRSQGIVPFLKVANDTAVAVNQGGKRRGAVCAYLEVWHLDVEEFLDLRKNTGDERRRTHDMNTALWVPDLFMQRVRDGEEWTLFCPSVVPDLHDLFGRAFAERYAAYEAAFDRGEIRLAKRIRAMDLWRRILTALYETGHPWLAFKDPSNIRSPQDHAGVIHGSNLCTEILLNTRADEVAVCNLGSVNLAAHVHDGALELKRLEETVRVAMRMLDNVIDLNYYPIPQAQVANLRHRPVGLGLMGFQDALWKLGLSYASDEAVHFADFSMEAIAYYATLASTELARERGAYPSFAGSKWDRGLLPHDTLDLLEAERGEPVEVERGGHFEWEPVREAIRRRGMRNSNCLAIAPTATIANIAGVTPSIEPVYANLYVKSNLSGEFTVVNEALVRDLAARGLWDSGMLEELKYHDGSVQPIHRVPDDLKARYPTAFEIEPRWLIACAARRQKWIDMGQSLNLYVSEPSGRKLSEIYQLAWRSGLKTTYYLRSRGATQIEKATLDINRWGIQPKWMRSRSPSAAVRILREEAEGASPACSLDGDCQACQ